jgi:hypothetical protein
MGKRYKFKCGGKFEQGSSFSSKGVIPSGTISLSAISSIVLGFSLSKNERLTVWSSDKLTEAQIKYAATDAWVSLKIFDAEKHKLEIGVRISAENCLPDAPIAFKPKHTKKPVAFGQIINTNPQDIIKIGVNAVKAPAFRLQAPHRLSPTERNNTCLLCR